MAAVVPGAGTLHTDTPEQFADATGARGWLDDRCREAFAPAPLVIDRIGRVA